MRLDAIDTTDVSPFAPSEAEQNAGKPETCKDAAAWLAEPDEADNPLVAEFIESGEMFAIVGQAKAGKSLIALQMAVSIALGVPFLNMDCTRRKVYVANLEVSEKQYKKRLRRICNGMDINPADLSGWLFIDNMKGETASWETALEKCKAHGCEVAMLDPFYQIARIVETDEQQCLDAVENMKQFTKAGITLGMVFHSPKGFSGDRQLIDMISGSSILARFPESVIGLLNHATEKTARVIDAVLRNYPPPKPFAVSIAEGMLEVAPDIEPDIATARNAWKRTQHADNQVDLEKYVLKVIKDTEQNTAEDYKGIPVGVLADKARKAYITETGKSLGEKRMPSEIKTLQADGKIIITNRFGKDGNKYAGTPMKMEWWTKLQLTIGSAKEVEK